MVAWRSVHGGRNITEGEDGSLGSVNKRNGSGSSRVTWSHRGWALPLHIQK